MSHILVFDSGVGGTTILKEIQSKIPKAQYSYVMDNAYLPYGILDKEQIQIRLKKLINWIETERLAVNLIVIACNTASTFALDATRQVTNIPIVGVVPAIKPAAELSKTKQIALLATPSTIGNEYTAKLINTYANNCQVGFYKSTNLVSIAEEVYWHDTQIEQAFNNEMQALNINKDIDVMILGCTHFPILKQYIQNYLNSNTKIIDSGAAIANRVKSVIEQSHLSDEIKMPLQFYVTAFNKKMTGKHPSIKSINLD